MDIELHSTRDLEAIFESLFIEAPIMNRHISLFEQGHHGGDHHFPQHLSLREQVEWLIARQPIDLYCHYWIDYVEHMQRGWAQFRHPELDTQLLALEGDEHSGWHIVKNIDLDQCNAN